MTFLIALGSVTAKSPANCSILKLNVYLDTCASVALTNSLFICSVIILWLHLIDFFWSKHWLCLPLVLTVCHERCLELSRMCTASCCFWWIDGFVLSYPLRSSYQTATFHDSCICLVFCLAGYSMVESHYRCHYSCCSAFSLAVFYHDSPLQTLRPTLAAH